MWIELGLKVTLWSYRVQISSLTSSNSLAFFFVFWQISQPQIHSKKERKKERTNRLQIDYIELGVISVLKGLLVVVQFCCCCCCLWICNWRIRSALVVARRMAVDLKFVVRGIPWYLQLPCRRCYGLIFQRMSVFEGLGFRVL